MSSGGRAGHASGAAYEQTGETWIRGREVSALPQIILHNSILFSFQNQLGSASTLFKEMDLR